MYTPIHVHSILVTPLYTHLYTVMSTQAAAHWASTLSYASLPPSVVHAAVRSFYNWVGCTIGGSSHPATSIAYRALSRFFGAPTSALLGTRTQVDAQHAALLNGIASHVHDYDDTHLETIIHPTGPVAAALLSIAQSLDRPVSGPELITALAAGIEIECKVGLAVWPSHYDVGW
jgi:aconitate decarboxylase